MKNRKFWIGLLVMVLAFGITGCDNNPGDGDTWSAVTSLSQLNGTWKGSYSQTMPIGDMYGMGVGDEDGGGGDMDLTTLFGDMKIKIDAEMTSTINASAKTQGPNISKTTITFLGGKINEEGIWDMIKESFGGEEEGATVTTNNSAHSITTTRTDPVETLTDAEITQFISILQINQSGNKVKAPAGTIGEDSPEIILSKQ